MTDQEPKLSECCGAIIWTNAGVNAEGLTTSDVCSKCGKPCTIASQPDERLLTPIEMETLPLTGGSIERT